MNGLILNIESQSDYKMLTALIKRLGIKAKILSDEETEEMALLQAMKEGQKTPFVSREDVMNTLKKNAK